jgi:nucleoside-diphosphate-sugar epimerase
MLSQPSTNSRVLVTRVNGFIGAHVANQFLQAGYAVLGTSRKVAKAQRFKDVFSQYGEDKFQIVELADLEDEGAFDELVKRKYLSVWNNAIRLDTLVT